MNRAKKKMKKEQPRGDKTEVPPCEVGKIHKNRHIRPVFILICTLPKNQAAPIEMVINDYFRIPKMIIAFVSLCHKVPKPKENCDCHVVAKATAIRSFCPHKHNFLFLKHEI